jgi:hypothetical protein
MFDSVSIPRATGLSASAERTISIGYHTVHRSAQATTNWCYWNMNSKSIGNEKMERLLTTWINQ